MSEEERDAMEPSETVEQVSVGGPICSVPIRGHGEVASDPAADKPWRLSLVWLREWEWMVGL